MKIEIVGSLDGDLYYTVEQIDEILEQEQTELNYGAAFMGRPGTKIYTSPHHIVKLRTELDLNPVRTREYINHILAQEQKVNVHHPRKTWFLLEQEENKFKVGNICPRLKPLHKLDEAEEVTTNEQKLQYLLLIYYDYFRIAKEYNLRLDEGLSNFGIDDNKNLYYLDDDIYSWDQFVSFSHFFGVLIRGNNWLDGNNAHLFGEKLSLYINKFFDDTHTRVMVAGKLQDINVPDTGRRKVMDIVIQQLFGVLIDKKPCWGNDNVHVLVDILRQLISEFFDDSCTNTSMESQLQRIHKPTSTKQEVLDSIIDQLFNVLIKKKAWNNEEEVHVLIETLQKLIAEFVEDSKTSEMVACKLQDIYIPDNEKQKILDIIIKQLQSRKIINKKVVSTNQYLAIIADVHANLPALESVLDFLKQENIKQGIILGDTVGYGPHPQACIELLQDSGFSVLKGNHDHAVVSGDTKRGMSSTARWCIEWTIPKLNAQHKEWLDGLPLELSGSIDGGIWQARHGAPIDPSYFYAYVYEMTYEKNLDFMAQRGLELCFHGHSHVQGIYARNKAGLDGSYNQSSQLLNVFNHSLICPGSVGQPRDGAIGAQLAIYDQKNHSMQFLTLGYSMEKTIQDMEKYGFPESLVTRLKNGS